MTEAPRHDDPRPPEEGECHGRLSRWRTAGAYFALQFAVLHVAISQLAEKYDARWTDRLRSLISDEILTATIPVGVLLASCQAVLLLPAEGEPAAHRGGSGAVWFGRLTCGTAVGALTATASFGVVWTLEHGLHVELSSWRWWGVGAGLAGVLAACGTVAWLATASPRGVPAWLRAVAAGGFGALGAAALAASAWGLARWMQGLEGDISEAPVTLTVAVAGFGSWVLWTVLLMVFLRRPHAPGRLARLARGLFAGSVMHAAALIPLDVMVRRRTSCYCAEMTLWSLSGTLVVGLFAVGPAIFLTPFVARRAALRRGFCPRCGYDLTSLPPPKVCPECGPG